MRGDGGTAAAGAAAVRLRGVTKRFARRRPLAAMLRRPRGGERVTALDDVSLSVGAGECVGLLGPNGAGKSTLFRVLLTLVIPDAGEAALDGLDVVDDAALVRARVAGASPDERSLYWRLSARENLRLYAALRGLPARERSARVDEVLHVVGLDDVGAQLVGSFSSGMRQRLLVARALVGRPAVLLLDEPTRSLDPVAADRFRRFLRDEVVARQGRTVLLATHTAEEAFDVCDRVAVLHRGRVLAEGPAHALAARHAGDRLALRVAAGDEGAARGLVAARGVAVDGGAAAADGWASLRVHLPGGEGAAAALVGALVGAGVAVAGAAPVRPGLGPLLAALTGERATDA